MQAQEYPDTSNRPEDYRSVGSIALVPSENEQGVYHFMGLETGKRIHRFKWAVLPFTQAVVDRVEELVENNEEEATFTDGNVSVIECEEDNNDHESDDEDNHEYESEEGNEFEYDF